MSSISLSQFSEQNLVDAIISLFIKLGVIFSTDFINCKLLFVAKDTILTYLGFLDTLLAGALNPLRLLTLDEHCHKKNLYILQFQKIFSCLLSNDNHSETPGGNKKSYVDRLYKW